MNQTLFFPPGTIFDKLYQYLWMNFDNTKNILPIRIPNTILISDHQPVAWIFTDKNGMIRKKKPQNLKYDEILRVFSKNRHKGCVVAELMSPSIQ